MTKSIKQNNWPSELFIMNPLYIWMNLLNQTRVLQSIKNMNVLAEVFKTTRGENPSFMNTIFSQKRMNYQLRTSNLLNFPKVTGTKYGFNAFGLCASQIWNQVPKFCQKRTQAKQFKTEMFKSLQVIKCTCSQGMIQEFNLGVGSHVSITVHQNFRLLPQCSQAWLKPHFAFSCASQTASLCVSQ